MKDVRGHEKLAILKLVKIVGLEYSTGVVICVTICYTQLVSYTNWSFQMIRFTPLSLYMCNCVLCRKQNIFREKVTKTNMMVITQNTVKCGDFRTYPASIQKYATNRDNREALSTYHCNYDSRSLGRDACPISLWDVESYLYGKLVPHVTFGFAGPETWPVVSCGLMAIHA